jgi:hypothetical protein
MQENLGYGLTDEALSALDIETAVAHDVPPSYGGLRRPL